MVSFAVAKIFQAPRDFSRLEQTARFLDSNNFGGVSRIIFSHCTKPKSSPQCCSLRTSFAGFLDPGIMEHMAVSLNGGFPPLSHPQVLIIFCWFTQWLLGKPSILGNPHLYRWWFQIFFIFTPT